MKRNRQRVGRQAGRFHKVVQQNVTWAHRSKRLVRGDIQESSVANSSI
uniref:Uncharacterized protein n=1 Tax=uncultured bacterium A1Q1_fos_1880 TaxID=1256556 RepID=L7VZD0_9BACT|nr:hypothetical protein [uncultured bacterium A1Q1_fos_1880]